MTVNNKTELSLFLIKENKKIIDAMKKMEINSRNVVFVSNIPKKVIGVITDGDIRRGLLRGLSLNSSITEIMTRNFYSIKKGTDRGFVLDLMKAKDIRHVPELNSEGHLLTVHFLHDLIGAAERPNLAVIMAGGRGTRLRPITKNLPKPLVPVAGRSILERLIMHIVGFGIRRIAISINYLGHMIEEQFGDGHRFGCSITYLREDRELGTGGSLKLLPNIKQEQYPILLLNGDLVTQADLAKLLDFHTAQSVEARYLYSNSHNNLSNNKKEQYEPNVNKVQATIAVKCYQHVVPYGVVESEKGRLIHLTEKPNLTFKVNAGIYVFKPCYYRNDRD